MLVIGKVPERLIEPLRAVEKLHTAFDRAPVKVAEGSRDSCILCALTIAELLAEFDIPAEAVPVAAIATAEGVAHGVGVGTEDRPGRWAGHLVCVADGFLIDAALYSLPWDGPKGMMAVQLAPSGTINGMPIITQIRTRLHRLAWCKNDNDGWRKYAGRTTSLRRDVVKALGRAHAQ